MFKKLLFIILVVCVVSSVQARAEGTKKSIVVNDAWVRLMPPTQKNTAAYMTIENNTDKELILESVHNSASKITETHKMEHKDGMMTMQKVNGIHIPAQGKTALEPGGFHLMLIGLSNSLKSGDKVSVQLHFNNGQDVDVTADVREDATKEGKSCCLHKH